MKRAPLVWLRVAAGGLSVIVVALAIDLWLRFFVLVAYRKDSVKRLAAFNSATRLWGDVLFAAARWAVSLDVRIEGRVPESGRFLIVANHQSSLDIPFLITTLRAPFSSGVTKRSPETTVWRRM